VLAVFAGVAEVIHVEHGFVVIDLSNDGVLALIGRNSLDTHV
jgi:hypothetical protein